MFALLDDVVLLSRGRLVWSGSSDDMLVHLEAQGLVLPPLTNPAEFILDVSSIDVRPAYVMISQKVLACLSACLLEVLG